MYTRRSRSSPRLQSKLNEYFLGGMTARAASELLGINTKTVTQFFMRLRYLIASKLPSYNLSVEIEADERYFCDVRKVKRSKGAAEKVAIFDLLKRGSKVYTAIIPNSKTKNIPAHYSRENDSRVLCHMNGIVFFGTKPKVNYANLMRLNG